jgi:hypothetical protein
MRATASSRSGTTGASPVTRPAVGMVGAAVRATVAPRQVPGAGAGSHGTYRMPPRGGGWPWSLPAVRWQHVAAEAVRAAGSIDVALLSVCEAWSMLGSGCPKSRRGGDLAGPVHRGGAAARDRVLAGEGTLGTPPTSDPERRLSASRVFGSPDCPLNYPESGPDNSASLGNEAPKQRSLIKLPFNVRRLSGSSSRTRRGYRRRGWR